MKKHSTKEQEVIRIDTRGRFFNVCMIGLCFIVLLGARLQLNQPTTGDEPYYLLMDYSMAHDRDLSLANNTVHKDFMDFYHSTVLTPQGTVNVKQSYLDKGYSIHSAGLPLLLLPGFYVAGKTGAVFTMVLLATLLVYLTWVWTKKITKNRYAAYATAGFLSVCYFFTGLAGTVYPDIPITIATLIALIVLEDLNLQKKGKQLLLGLTLGFLILIHFKGIAIAGPVLAILAYKQWRQSRTLPWLAAGITALFLAYYTFTLHQWFGAWTLSSIGGQTYDGNPFRNISAMLFDSNRGLLVYNPILILVFVGLPLWLRSHARSLISVLIIVLPSMAILASIPNWNGSAAPPGRYLVEIFPVFLPAIAYVLINLTKVWQKIAVALLATATFAITFDAVSQRFAYIDGGLFQTRSLLFAQIDRHTGVALDSFLPTYSNQTTPLNDHNHLILLVCYAQLGVLIAYGCYLAKLNPKVAALKLRNAIIR